MNFSELKTELVARGFDHLSATRQGVYVNLGYHELCEQAEWLFLYASTTGTAPITVSDLRTVLSVEDTADDRKLSPLDIRQLTDEHPDLPDTGDAVFYYFTGQTTIAVYPADTTTTFKVRYVKVPADLTGTDTPVVPTRYHYAIVDYAVARACADNGDANGALAARLEGDRLVEFMVQSLLDPQRDGPSQFVPGSGDDW